MRKITSSLLAVAAALALGINAHAQTSVTTDPVGFLTSTITGPASQGGSSNSFIGLSFTQTVAYQATLSSASGTTLVDSNATWADNQYNGANGQFYVELISGSGAGRMSNITGTSNAGKSITTADDLSSFVTAGTTYKIRKNWTVGSVFGPNDESGLAGGTSTTADEILVYNPSTGVYTTYYYKTSGIGGTGWRSTASTSTDASNSAFNSTDGLIVRRHTTGNVNFSLAGAVKLGQTSIPIATGLNLVSNPYPSGNLTLGNSGLLTSGIGQGTSTTADQILIYNTSTGVYDTYYYKNSGIGGTGWRSTASTSLDASSAPIPFGASIIVQRNQGRVPFQWVAPQPF